MEKHKHETTKQWLAREKKEEKEGLIWFIIGIIVIVILFGFVLYKCFTMPWYIWA